MKQLDCTQNLSNFFNKFFLIIFSITILMICRSANAINPYIYDYEENYLALDSIEEQQMTDDHESSKEKILLGLLKYNIKNLEHTLNNLKYCVSLAKAHTCADQNSYCESALSVSAGVHKSVDLIQSHMQKKYVELRGIASQSEFKFSQEDQKMYYELKVKAHRLKLETNKFCLAAR